MLQQDPDGVVRRSETPLSPFFSNIFYKNDNNFLSLIVDDYSFPVDETFSLSYDNSNNIGILNIQNQKKTISINYDSSAKPFISTLHYSEEEEDANFGLWLLNVLNSQERKEILLNNW